MKFHNCHTSDEVIEATKCIEEKLDETFRSKFRMDSRQLKFLNEIYTNGNIFIHQSVCEKINPDLKVTKSYQVDNDGPSGDWVCWEFLNEMLSQKIVNTCDKKEYFTELIGFILGIDEYHPYYATIVLKWYNLGDLYDFAFDINDSNLKNQIEKLESKDINVFLDIAHQIARGL